MTRRVTHEDCYRAVDEAIASLKTDAQKQAFVEALRRRFVLRCEQKLKVALSRPVPDLNEVRRCHLNIKEMRA